MSEKQKKKMDARDWFYLITLLGVPFSVAVYFGGMKVLVVLGVLVLVAMFLTGLLMALFFLSKH